jgi:multiple RNA-binding domain-containing protein 1
MDGGEEEGTDGAEEEEEEDGGDSEDSEQFNAAARGDQSGVGVSGGHGGGEAGAVPGVVGEEGEALVLDTGRLFVRNLAYTAAEADLAGAFGEYGVLEEVHLVMDR